MPNGKPYLELVIEDGDGRVYFVTTDEKDYDHPLPGAEFERFFYHQEPDGGTVMVLKTANKNLGIRGYEKPPASKWKW